MTDSNRLYRLAAALLPGLFAFVLAGCSSDSSGTTEPDGGDIEVSVTTSGDDMDPDGYTIRVDEGESQTVGLNGTAKFTGLESGSHLVELLGVVDNCTIQGSNPKTVSIATGNTAPVSFNITCVARVGDVEVELSTTGTDIDSDGYMVTVDGSSGKAGGPNGKVMFEELSEGDHEFEVTGVASNCVVSGENPRTVPVAFDETESVAFGIVCSTALGDLTAETSTGGSDIDSDGYDVVVDGTLSQHIGTNSTTTFTNLAAGDHSVELTAVASNCAVGGTNPRTVSVTANEAVTTTFNVTCDSLFGGAQVQTSTSGVDLDPDGYTVLVDSSSSQSIGLNGSVTFDPLSVGDHQVELTGLAGNCSVNGANPRTVTVPSGDVVQTEFDVTCVTNLGALQAKTSTTGTDLDPDGYTVEVDGSINQSVGVNDSTTFKNLDVSDHSVKLTGLAANCAVNGQNPRTVTVVFGDTVSTTFDVECTPTTGSIQVTAATGGSDTDPDGYTVTLDGGSSQGIGANGSVTFTDVPIGDHSLDLSGLATTCSAESANPADVTVTGGETAQVTFDVGCYAIYFTSDRTGNDEIFKLSAGGTVQNQVTSDPGDDRWPNIAPDGSKMVFARDGDIWVANADGSNETKLTGPGGNDYAPAWSPSGNRIAFTRINSGNHDVMVMNSDGSGVTNLTNNAAVDQKPTWSSDGSKIAFATDRDGNSEIYVMSAADGSGLTNLTRDSGDDFEPSWSPDGTAIIWTTTRNGRGEIYIMNTDGSGQTNLSSNLPTGDFTSAWSPNSDLISFTTDRDGDEEVYVMKRDGTGQVNITQRSGSQEGFATWSP